MVTIECQQNLVSVAALLGLAMMLVASVAAQDIGSGDPIIEPNFGDDPTTFNPIIANDGTSYDVINRMFPNFIGIDSETVQYIGGAKGALVSSLGYRRRWRDLHLPPAR